MLYYSLYFKLLSRKIAEYNILLENIYNIDEKGFLFGFFIKIKIKILKRLLILAELKMSIKMVSIHKIRPIWLRQKDRFFWANWTHRLPIDRW